MSFPKKKILLADPSLPLISEIKQFHKASEYDIEAVSSGRECIDKIAQFHPDLLVIDLMLPHMHAIEILRKIKTPHSKFGVIISSYHINAQNYHATVAEGAHYFLAKPFDIEFLFLLFERYFSGTLTIAPFSLKKGYHYDQNICYQPNEPIQRSYIRFWGTRGSNPVSGPTYMRYGGNTSCLEVRYGNDHLIIDAGTGIRPLGEMLLEKNDLKVHLFIGHTHWDHMSGFPFFNPIYHNDSEVTVWAPVGFEKSTPELFNNMFDYSYFPVRLEDMRSQVIFNELREGKEITIGEIKISSHFTNHPGPTLCFKISSPKMTIGYVTDNEVLLGYQGAPQEIDIAHPLLEPHLSLIHFLKGCDLLVHEAQYFQNEYTQKIGWGHSSISNATVLVKHTGCPEWIVTHHDPKHEDQDLLMKTQIHLDLLKECQMHTQVRLAYDGLMIPF